ncbi:hypothetical protein FQN54_003974 [Arachnomyces sp. PD_36]|nr:hypothetical protein FQN54_003974 [Arachnomyces sp. PD_36]
MLQSGLAFIRSFITVDSFEEGLKIIYSKAEIRRPPPPYRKWLSYDPHHDQAMLKEYSLEKIESLIYPSFLMDLDNGPAEAWRWTFASEYSVSFGYNPRTRELRRSGYIMWDYARLVDWGFFQGDWVPPSLDRSPDDVKREQAYRRAQSWKETWCTGAKGWWSAGDQSQVTFWGRAPSGFGESIPYEEAYEDDLLFAR